MSNRMQFVLVHSPLVGRMSWQPTAAALSAMGYEALVPALDWVAGAPYLNMADVALEGGSTLLLAGHSGAGPLLPELGRQLAPVAAGYIFVDAGLPHPGEAWCDQPPVEQRQRILSLMHDGAAPPWPTWWPDDVLANILPDPELRARYIDDCPRVPAEVLTRVFPEVPGWPDAGCGYIRISEAYDVSADRATTLGWPVLRLDDHHLAPFTSPNTVAAALLEMATQLVQR